MLNEYLPINKIHYIQARIMLNEYLPINKIHARLFVYVGVSVRVE